VLLFPAFLHALSVIKIAVMAVMKILVFEGVITFMEGIKYPPGSM
jgi:hypothetical protein